MDNQNSVPAALHDSARRLEAVLNNATVAIFLMDDRQHCIYMNRAAEELTGYTLDEVASLDRPLHDIIHHTYPDGRPFPLEECAIDRAFPEHHKVGGEEIFVHKDGTFYPVAFMASPIKDDASKTIGTIIEVRDIREEKIAAELQRRLINELDHRARNTLATIQAVAWQSFRGTEPERLARFNGRIAALSAAHAILTDTSWRGADLRPVGDHPSKLPATHARQKPRRIRVRGVCRGSEGREEAARLAIRLPSDFLGGLPVSGDPHGQCEYHAMRHLIQRMERELVARGN